MEFYKQEDWSELLFPIPGELPNPGIELVSLASPAGRQILYYHAISMELGGYLSMILLTDAHFPDEYQFKGLKIIPLREGSKI